MKKAKIIIILAAIFILCVAVGCVCGILVGRSANKEELSRQEIFDVSDVVAENQNTEADVITDLQQNQQSTEGNVETAPEREYDENNSYIRIINRSNPIPADYIAGTGELKYIEGKQMESEACDALSQMVSDLRADGLSIIVQSGYRTDGDQEYLYDRQIGRQGGDKFKAATISAVPLTSEHQAGLAVDLSVDGSLTEAFSSTPQGQWLKEHCAAYGYVLRYPKGKEEITGIISEPWHFRYVGSPETAAEIMNSGLCMEEFYGIYLNSEDIDPYLPYL